VAEVLRDVQQLLRVVVPEKLNLNAKQVLAANGQLVKDAVAANGKVYGKLGIKMCYPIEPLQSK
jgi:hypothetical protein